MGAQWLAAQGETADKLASRANRIKTVPPETLMLAQGIAPPRTSPGAVAPGSVAHANGTRPWRLKSPIRMREPPEPEESGGAAGRLSGG